MELEKQMVHKSKQAGTAFSQMTLDDDYNLPDYKPDLAKIIRERGQLQFEEIHVNNGHILARGVLKFQILYRTDLDGRKVNYLKGEIPFQESLSMEGVLETDDIKVTGRIADISVSVINSRKLSIRSLAELKAVAERKEDVELLTGTDASCEIEKKRQEFLELVMKKRDTLRIRQEISIASNKPNMEEIVWSGVELRGIDSRINDGQIDVYGEALVQILYIGDEDEERLQWFETTVPVKGSVACEDCSTEQLYHIATEISQMNLEIAPDLDGESRNISLEMILGMDICVWRETYVEMISDMYALDREIKLHMQPTVFERLLVKNAAKCKVAEKVELDVDLEDAVQICMQEVELDIEQYKTGPEGVLVEGILTANILYLTADDSMPVNSKRVYIPFSQTLEMPESKLQVNLYLECRPEQVTTILTDSRTIEVRGVIVVHALAIEEIHAEVIAEVTEEAQDIKQLQQRPGLVGYIVRESDTLFGIAKEHHTTIQNLMETNGLSDKNIKRGEKLLIVKEI